jgi:hypothetical protein
MGTEKQSSGDDRVTNVDKAKLKPVLREIVKDAFWEVFVLAIFVVAGFSVGYNFALLSH